MNNFLKIFFIIIFALLLSRVNVLSWTWLMASSWDMITVAKWNEMIAELDSKLYITDIIAGDNISVVNSWSQLVINYIWPEIYPYFSWWNIFLKTWINQVIKVFWQNFNPNATISIPWVSWINSINVISPTEIDLDITASWIDWNYNLEVSNWSFQNTFWSWNWLWVVNLKTPVYWTGPAGIYTEWLENNLWNWTNSVWNWANFTFDTNWTPSAWTWPEFPSTGTYYAFTETSNPNFPSVLFAIETSYFSIAESISFDYHMYWVDIWTLSVEIFDWTSWVEVYSLSWQQQNANAEAWRNTWTIDLTLYDVEDIKIKYISWANYQWDAWIDNIIIQSM